VNKVAANYFIKQSLAENHISYTSNFTGPTILKNILWYGLAKNDSTVSIGEFTLLKKDHSIRWLTFDRKAALLDNHPDTADVRLLKWFSKGYYVCRQNHDTLNVYCVKFGRMNMTQTDFEKTFIYHYKLFFENEKWQMTVEEPNEKNANMIEAFQDLMRRIGGSNEWVEGEQ